jgi:hypothetical protein
MRASRNCWLNVFCCPVALRSLARTLTQVYYVLRCQKSRGKWEKSQKSWRRGCAVAAALGQVVRDGRDQHPRHAARGGGIRRHWCASGKFHARSQAGVWVFIAMMLGLLNWPVSFAQSLMDLAQTPRFQCPRAAILATAPNGDR